MSASAHKCSGTSYKAVWGSGGIDSTGSALSLVQNDFPEEGMFLRHWRDKKL